MPALLTLGGLELTGGHTGALQRRRRELLLVAALARRAPRAVGRAQLAALVWGDRDEARARHSLRQALSELRTELGDLIEITPDTVRIDSARLEFDVLEFERAVAAGRDEDAAALWRGDFLAGCEELGTEELRGWIEQERAGLREKLAWVYRRLAEGARSQGDWRTAIAVADRWCHDLPYDEEAQRSAVDTLRRAGQVAEAASRHASFVARLRTDLGIAPSDQFVRLGGLPAPPSTPGPGGLSRLEHLWSATRAGSGASVVVLGEAGAGKSGLCREFLREVRSRADRATVIEARAFEEERTRPWSALRPILVALADASGLLAAPAAALARAAEIAPEIRERMPNLPAASADAPMADAVARILGEVAAESPLLLSVDDVSSADPESLEVFQALAKRPPPGCLLLLAARPAALAARAPALAAVCERIELPSHPRIGGRRRTWTVVTAFAATALVAGWFALRPGQGALSAGSVVLLADVHNQTGDSTLGRAFYTAATVGLQGSRHVMLFPRYRVRETLARMKRTGADSVLTEQLAREVALREGLAAVVALGITQVDSSFLLSARLIATATGADVEAASLRVDSRAELLDGMDQLLQRARKALGESSRDLRAGEPLPRLTTSSLEALREYVAAGDAWTRRNNQGARDHYERALALDTSFAMAMAGLADVFYIAYSDRARGLLWMNRALAQADRLTARERLRLQAQAAFLEGRDDAAADYSLRLAEQYPSRDTWFNHGSTLLRQYRCREAIPSLRKSIGFDTLFTNGHINLATCLQITGPPDAAVEAYLAAERTDSTVLYRANLNHEWGVALVRAGQPERAESAYARMAATGNSDDRARGMRSLAWLSLHRGQVRRAIGHLEVAIKLNQSAQVQVSVFRNQLILSHACLLAGDSTRSRRLLDSATALYRTIAMVPAWSLYLGQAQVRAGRVAAARQTLAGLARTANMGNSYDRAVQQALQSHVELAEGSGSNALATAAPTHDPRMAPYRYLAQALAFAAANQTDSALAAAVRLSNEFSFGTEGQFEWQRGPFLVARYAEARGDSATARAAYQRVLEQWKAGDADLPDLVRARAALSRLSADAGRRN